MIENRIKNRTQDTSKPCLQFGFRTFRKLPIILQDEHSECAHACVTMIAQYFGHKINLPALRKFQPPSGRGTNLLAIKQLLEQLDLKARPLRVSLEEIHLIKCPAILHWNMNHFVVLKAVKKNHFVIHDPAMGQRICTLEAFSKAFTGIAVEVERFDNFKVLHDQSRLQLRHIVQSLQGIQKFTALLLILSLVIEFFALLNPLFMQFVTDKVIGFHDLNNLFVIASGFILLICAQVFTEYIRGHLIVYVSSHVTEQFSSHVMRHLLKLSLDFFEKRHKGDIQSKFHTIDQIQKKITADFINMVLDGFMILLNIVVMLFYSRLLTSIVLVAQILIFGMRYGSFQILKKQTETSIVQHARSASVFLETLQAMLPIKIFLKEQNRFNTWRNAYINAMNADIKIARLSVFYNVLGTLLSHIEHVLVICTSAVLVLNNQFSLGMLMAFMSYRMLFVSKTASFIQQVFEYRLIGIQLNRLSDIVLHPPEKLENQVAAQSRMGLPKLIIQGALTLKQVCFQYHPQENFILENISCHIDAGEKVAIIGPSGRGKSTLLKVMMGLLLPSSGEILIDNISLEGQDRTRYRTSVAAVMQDDALLSGSILDNIAFFEEDIDLERVYAVAKLAYIHEVICAFPMGYETLVGDMGSTLSGGQKQRILLARALYKQPKILFLDEATSHLDSEHEKKINTALKALNITQIIVAHREETIKMADRVISLY